MKYQRAYRRKKEAKDAQYDPKEERRGSFLKKGILRERLLSRRVETVYRRDGEYFHVRCDAPLEYLGKDALQAEQWRCRQCIESVFISDEMKRRIPEKPVKKPGPEAGVWAPNG